MGHPSDWDDIRDRLNRCNSDLDSSAIEIGPATDWHAGLQNLAIQISQPSILVGYSMGARLALGLALEFPEYVSGMIFIAGNPGIEASEDRVKRATTDAELMQKIDNLSGKQAKACFLSQWYQQEVFAHLTEETRGQEIDRKLAADHKHWSSILEGLSVAKQPNYWLRLPELSIPVLVVAGEQDKKYNQIAVRFKRSLANHNSAVVIVPGCGHIVHREQPKALVQAILDYLKSLPR